jgi:hypothetical protein
MWKNSVFPFFVIMHCEIKSQMGKPVGIARRVIFAPNLFITLQRYNTENSKQIFPEEELRGLSPNSYIYKSVIDSYIPAISLPILLQENRWTDPGYI